MDTAGYTIETFFLSFRYLPIFELNNWFQYGCVFKIIIGHFFSVLELLLYKLQTKMVHKCLNCGFTYHGSLWYHTSIACNRIDDWYALRSHLNMSPICVYALSIILSMRLTTTPCPPPPKCHPNKCDCVRHHILE